MKSLSDCKLYTFVDTAYLRGRSPESVARQLCDGGSDIIQLRAKDCSEAQIRAMAETLLPICQKAGVRLVINDHPRIAFELSSIGSTARCVGCHLGQEDFFDAGNSSVLELRKATSANSATGRVLNGSIPESGGAVLSSRRDESKIAQGFNPGLRATNPEVPKGRLNSNNPSEPETSRPAEPACFIGLSSHAPAQAQRAIYAGADYIAIGPIYATATKPTARPVTLDYVRWAAANVTIPWFAIGGINLDTLDAVLEAGATRVCIVSAILNADDIASVCAQFRQRLG